MNDTRRQVLESLEEGPIPGPTLADRLDVSRAAVWKQIEALRDSGFAIEGTPNGYVLAGVSGYDAATIEYELDAPLTVEYHDSIGSTNDRARELARNGAEDVVVVADEQTGGRGRLDREWVAPAGGVWLSVVCRPSVPPARASLYTLAASVATANAAREAGVDTRIKWPNDVVVPLDSPVGTNESSTPVGTYHTPPEKAFHKLAGILTEMTGETDGVEWLIVGIGVNANIDSAVLPEEATSLQAEVGDVERRTFVARLLEEFDRLRGDLASVVPEWRALGMTIGQQVRVTRPDGAVVGEAVDLTETGALVVETTDGRVTISSGDCEHLRPVDDGHRP